MKKRSVVIILIISMAIILCSCREIINQPLGQVGNEDIQYQDDSKTALDEVSNLDTYTGTEMAVQINLSDLNVPCSTENYLFDGSCLEINHAGEYFLTGEFKSGKIVIKVFEDEIVHLILSDVELESKLTSAIDVEEATKVILTLAEETQTTISDSAYSKEEACIFSNSDITINGKGTLRVYGYSHDAIRSKDKVKIVGTNVIVKSKNNGIRGNEGVLIENSVVDVESEGTGIISPDIGGYVIAKDSDMKVIAGENAIAAKQYVALNGGEENLFSVKEQIRCEGTIDFDVE